MLISKMYMYFWGYVIVSVEGFFIERFLNICRNQKIVIEHLEMKNSTYVIFRILKSDFKKIRCIAKNTKCKVRIKRKFGLPFLINRYRKRKVFAVALVVIAIFIFIITRFVWNVEVHGNKNIETCEILNMLEEYGIRSGNLKSKINKERIGNLIRLNREDISWIGISIKGTNAIITIEEAVLKPEIIDKSEICNIVSDVDGTISKIIVQSGTARVSVGDEVKKGDILVEGIMEGVNTGVRNVHSEATIFANILYEKERKECFVQNVKNKTGNIEEKNEICINNFKINLNKGVSKFENCDTICTNKKIKLFSDLYIPVEIIKTSYIEKQKNVREYTQEELINKLKIELEQELIDELSFDKEKILEKNYTVYTDENNVYVKVILVVEENISQSVEVVF